MKTQQLKRCLGLAMISGLLILQATLVSARQATTESLFDQLQQQEVLRIQLEVDLDQLLADKTGVNYLPATLSFKDINRQDQTYNAEVKVRGKFRLMTCEFPPLKIKLSKKDLAAKGLEEYNDFKLVTHCMDNLDNTDEALLKEYLSYKLYNELTNNSFRVKLVRVTYKDIDSNSKITHYGILLEDEEELAQRINGQICENCYGVKDRDINQQNAMTQALFQFMIGNTDWSVSMVRNVKLLRVNGAYVIVPFDFDFSGLVNAPYAKPNADYGLRSVRERYFMGTVVDTMALQQTVDLFKAKKKALLRLVERADGLSWETKQDLVQYLLSFYSALEDGSFLLNDSKSTDSATQNQATPR